MACRTLLRRKTQLDLLARVCAQGVTAHLALRRNTAVIGVVALTALERDGVLVNWIGQPVPEVELKGQPVEVRFEYEGEHYVFRAVSRECFGRSRSAADAGAGMKLGLPVRLEHARRRRHVRLVPPDLPPIEGTFTHVIDGRRQFRARLTDIADGGIGVTARARDVPRLFTGDLFWVELELPGEAAHPEVVVRLVHLRPIPRTDEMAMGWVFQPTDDVANYDSYVRRLEALASRRHRPQA